MKKIIALLILLPALAYAQPDDYVVHPNDDPLLDNYGKKYPGYYVTKDGTKSDCLILFETGDKIGSTETMLSTSMSYKEPSKGVNKSSLSAFFVNNRLYNYTVLNDTAQWVHIVSQGAIHKIGHTFHVPLRANRKMELKYDPVKQVNVAYWDTLDVYNAHWAEAEYLQKLDAEPKNLIIITRKKIMSLVADNEDLASKIKNKESGYKPSLMAAATEEDVFSDRMFAIYNKWYDEQNPGAITYYPTAASYKSPDSPPQNAAPVEEVAGPTVSAYEKEVVAAAEEAHRAPRIDVFKGRPTAATAEVASAKPEVAVKKESFKGRLARIKADGNKVGVLVTSKNLLINTGTFSEGITKANVMGSYEPLTGLDALANATANELNQGFGTDVFEAVDYAQIPVKQGKYNKLDDWWATKYKVIVLYELSPSYIAYYKTVDAATGEREFTAQMKVNSEMIVMAAEDIKPDKLRYVTSSPKAWGFYRSEKYKGPAETDFHIIQQLKAAINPPSDKEIIDAIIKSQKEKVDKFISKKSK